MPTTRSALRSILSRTSRTLTLRLIGALFRVPGCYRSVVRCPVCGSTSVGEEYLAPYMPLDRCGECDHVYSRKVPGRLILGLMYGGIEYWVRDKEHQGITTIAVGSQWQGFLDARFGALRKAGLLGEQPMAFYEVGCSEGMLLRALRDLGHEARGCECNGPTALEGMRSLGIDIDIGLFEDLAVAVGHYDVVLSFHTVEHLADLHGTLDKVCRILKPDGALLVEVPTGPEEYTNTDHLQFFSERSLTRLLEGQFESATVWRNSYSTAAGMVLGSIYGLGRRPRR